LKEVFGHHQLAQVSVKFLPVDCSGVLDDDADDTLINVNIVDDEKAARNVENKKKKPGYQAYDDTEFDEYGTVSKHFCYCSVYSQRH